MGDLLRQHTTHVGPAAVPGQLFDTGRYPAAVASSESSDVIHGELYQLDDPEEVWAWLDEYEGYFSGNEADSLFVRRLALVEAQGRQPLQAWMYWYNRSLEGFEPIASGRYRRLRHGRARTYS